MKKIKLLILIMLYTTTLIAQNNTLTAHLGYSNFLNKKANGFSMGFDYRHKVASKHFLGVAVSYVMTERRGILPDDLGSSNTLIRDFTNQPPLPGFVWTKESFPKYQLSSKPDKYFNFNVSINYNYRVWENIQQSLNIGSGVVITFNDEQELVELVQASNLTSPLYNFSNFQIAVTQYDTYIDLGFLPQIEYVYQLKNGVRIGAINKYYCYPKSNRYVAEFAPFISFTF